MANRLLKLEIHNFRSLEDVCLDAKDLNVLFGPNGAGKSALLDTIWFVRDCAIRGVDVASSERSHGIGVLWDGANDGDNIIIRLETESADYQVTFGYSSGRIEPFVGERLLSKIRGLRLIERKIGSDKAEFYHTRLDQQLTAQLREPEKLALTRYLDMEEDANESSEVDKLLRYIRFYHTREAALHNIRSYGSEANYQIVLWERGQNLWSVLRNIKDRRSIDNRYDTLIEFMQESFPGFRDLLFEQTGPNSVYGSFVETKRRHPIQASGVSDGHLQMLFLLTALFSEGKERYSMIIFDEPEISLHPYALATFAKAVKLAAEEWNKQIFIATHSPVLISQFEPENILAVEIGERGETQITRVSQMHDIKDLLEEYATGSLYMAELIAAQSKDVLLEVAQ